MNWLSQLFQIKKEIVNQIRYNGIYFVLYSYAHYMKHVTIGCPRTRELVQCIFDGVPLRSTVVVFHSGPSFQTLEESQKTCIQIPEQPINSFLFGTDMLVLDTEKSYGRLRRELYRWSPYVRQAIIITKSGLYKEQSEIVREGLSVMQKSIDYAIPYDELVLGIQNAIDEFVVSSPDWTVYKEFMEDDGYLVLCRISRTNLIV